MNERIRDMLIKTAKNGDIITYGEIADLENLPMETDNERNHLFGMLDEINRAEDAHDRPLLTVLVVNRDTKRPGPGFFKLAKILSRQPKGMSNEDFFLNELQRVYGYWQNQP